MNYRHISKVPGWRGLYAPDRSAALDGTSNLLIGVHSYFNGIGGYYDTVLPKQDEEIQKRLISKMRFNGRYRNNVDQAIVNWNGTVLLMEERDRISLNSAHVVGNLGRRNNIYFLRTGIADTEFEDMGWEEFTEFAGNFPRPVFLMGGRLRKFSNDINEDMGCLGYHAYEMEESGIPVRFLRGVTFFG
ncbi:MAG: hypothetical protein JW716_03990 [Candidatus Aenigmarchaeota archaeon]|nr:hypothetical protein [Candidatus Aenigmarchaeota archaeon]